MFRRCTITILFVSVTGSSAWANIVIGGIAYVESGATELVAASFATPDGGVSSQTYCNFAKIHVSGSGQSDGTRWNDAFWVYTDEAGAPWGPWDSGGYYQLAVATNPLTASFPEPSGDVANRKIVYDLDSGAEVLQRPYMPSYQPSHEYNLVLDVGTPIPSALHFGVSDGKFEDNSGTYNIAITQLDPRPEPSTLTLLGVGGIVLFAYAWRRRMKSSNPPGLRYRSEN